MQGTRIVKKNILNFYVDRWYCYRELHEWIIRCDNFTRVPGASNFLKDKTLCNMLRHQNEKGRLIAAICGAPAVVLEPLGLLKGRTATCYPSMANKLKDCTHSNDRVVVSHNISKNIKGTNYYSHKPGPCRCDRVQHQNSQLFAWRTQFFRCWAPTFAPRIVSPQAWSFSLKFLIVYF